MNTITDANDVSWQPNPELAKWADRQGFAEPRRMSSESFAVLRSSEGGSHAGIYLWESKPSYVYLGISTVDVTKRLRDHANKYGAEDPQQFRYLKVVSSKEDLRRREREMTHELQRQGFVVLGREYTASLNRGEPQTSVFSLEEEGEWRRSPASVNVRRLEERKAPALGVDERSRSTFEKFLKRNDLEEILDAIAVYLRECVPLAARSENLLWSMSCLPNWKSPSGDQRIITINLGFQEVLWFAQEPSKENVSVCMSYDGRDRCRSFSLIPLLRYGVFPSKVTHKRGGPYEKTTYFVSPASFVTAMRRSSALRSAGADFALDQVRQRRVSSRWRDSHNSLLAAEAYARMAEPRLATF